MGAVREFKFIVGPETATLPTAGTPSLDTDLVTKLFGDTTYARRASWLESVQTVAAAKAITAAIRVDNQSLYIDDLAAYFTFDAASSDADDGTTILQPDAGTGRWIRRADRAAASGVSSFDKIVGSAADVTAGDATDSTIIAAIAAAVAGNSIFVLDSYVATENPSVDKQLHILGQGRGSKITGTLTVTSDGDDSLIEKLGISGKITLNSGSEGVIIDKMWSDLTVIGDAIEDNGAGNFIGTIILE